jgi:MGT family glycosyltransferase
LEVLQRSAVCVTHGGLNTVEEALYYGVPLVVVPQGVDQFVTAGRVEALGAGVRLDSSTLSAEGLRRAVERVLSDESFRQGSKAIGESFRAAGGYRRAAEEILSFRSLHRHQAA